MFNTTTRTRNRKFKRTACVAPARRRLSRACPPSPRPLASGDDEHGVVSRHRPDDLGPPGGVEREPERLGAPRRRFQHEQGTYAIQRHERRGQELLQLRPDRRAGVRRWSVVRATVRRRDLGQAQVPDVARQRRLRDVEPLGLEELAQLLLARDGLRADDLEDRGVTLRFHGAGM